MTSDSHDTNDSFIIIVFQSHKVSRVASSKLLYSQYCLSVEVSYLPCKKGNALIGSCFQSSSSPRSTRPAFLHVYSPLKTDYQMFSLFWHVTRTKGFNNWIFETGPFICFDQLNGIQFWIIISSKQWKQRSLRRNTHHLLLLFRSAEDFKQKGHLFLFSRQFCE